MAYRLIFYRSTTGGHCDLRSELYQLGIEHHELPERRGAPRIEGQEIELGVHYNQPFDLTRLGRTPSWEYSRDWGLVVEGGAAMAVAAALRRERCGDDQYLHHHEWAAAHRDRIRRVWLTSGGVVPELAIALLRSQFPPHIHFLATSIEAYKKGYVDAALEQDPWVAAANLRNRMMHAAARRDVTEVLDVARQLGLRLQSIGADQQAEDVFEAMSAANPLAALQQIPRPLPPRDDAASAPLQLPQPFSIHLLSATGLEPAITALLPDWLITWDRDEYTAGTTIAVDRQQVFIIDRRPGIENMSGIQKLVAAARDRGSVTVSWSDQQATPLDVHLEWHHRDARTPARFVELLRRIDQQHPHIRDN